MSATVGKNEQAGGLIDLDTWNVWHVQLMPQLARLTLFMSVVGNGIDIARATDRSEGVTISFQVILRLLTTALATMCGAWGWWRLAEVRQALTTFRGRVAVCLIGLTFASSLTAHDPKVAFFVAWAIATYLLTTLTCLSLFGMRRTLMDALMGLWSFVVISWVLKVVSPQTTVFLEYLSAEETLPRFGGLGHPNVLSAIQCLGVLLLLVSVREKLMNPLWLIPAVGLLVATVVATKSRTPVIAFTAAIGAFAFPLLRYRATYLLPAAAVVAVMLAAVAVEATMGLDRAIDQVALKMTKTGTVDELTSATGRTEIWARATALIKRSPLTGYGGGSSSQVMFEHSGHAHNLLLETALLFGVPAALLFVSLIGVNLYDSFRGRTMFVREFTAFLLVLGLVESPLFGLVPDPSMCIWMSCLFGPVICTGRVAAGYIRERGGRTR